MQVVIDIDEYEYKRVKELVLSGLFDYAGITPHLFKSVANGTPLPKGHGDLKDVDWIDASITEYFIKYPFDKEDNGINEGLKCACTEIAHAPTIIEAD